MRRDGEPGSYDIPAGTDVRSIAGRLAPERTELHAVLLLRPGTCHPLRRGADTVELGVSGPGGGSWDRVVLTRATVDLAAEVLSYGPDAYVVEPAELRDAVVARLDEVVA